MMRNLTPDHLRCPYADCPSIHELEDGSGDLLIVGKWGEAVAVAYGIPVGHDEQAIVISRDLLAGVMCQADSTAARDPVSASPLQSGDGGEAKWRPIETCPYYTDVFLAYQADGGSHKESKYGLGSFSGKGNLWDWGWAMLPTHWMPILPLQPAGSSDEEPALAGDTVPAASTEASLTPKTSQTEENADGC